VLKDRQYMRLSVHVINYRPTCDEGPGLKFNIDVVFKESSLYKECCVRFKS
jgi:hypothetical protein